MKAKIRNGIVLGAIAGTVVACFTPVLWNGFVLWDDDVNILENYRFRGLGRTSLKWMFTTFHMGPYQPLSWMTLALDYRLWGLNAAGYHLTSLLLHVANAMALYGVLRILLAAAMRTRADDAPCPERESASDAGGAAYTPAPAWCCAVGALFFAVHPLRVESVAWATERRDVLSGLFYLLSARFYLLSARRGRAEAPRTSGVAHYAASIACFALGLLSKASGVMLPLVFLLLDAYPLGRLRLARAARTDLRAAIFNKAPFLLLSLGFGVAAVWGQRQEAMLAGLNDMGVPQRLAQAAYGLCFYVWKTVAPVGLSPLYLRDQTPDPWSLRCLGPALIAAGAAAAAGRWCRRAPGTATSLAAYALLVLPVSGIAQAGLQIAADRYTYLPAMALSAWVAGAVARLDGWVGRRGRLAGLAPGLVLPGLLALGRLTFLQTHVWRDTLSLWNHALALDPDNYLALNNRGNYHEQVGRRDRAMADYEASIRARGDYAIAFSNRGRLRQEAGDLAGALDDYNRAIALRPRAVARVYNNRGNIWQQTGDAAAALQDYAAAIAIDPDFWEVYSNRARLRLNRGDLDGALRDYGEVIRVKPDHAEAFVNRGYIRLRKADWLGCEQDSSAGLRLDPTSAVAFLNRGIARKNLGSTREAIEDLSQALRLAPAGWPYRASAENNLSDLLGAGAR